MNKVWHEYHDNVVSLGRWLVENKGFTANEIIGYFEKPWKWSDEYKEMREAVRNG